MLITSQLSFANMRSQFWKQELFRISLASSIGKQFPFYRFVFTTERKSRTFPSKNGVDEITEFFEVRKSAASKHHAAESVSNPERNTQQDYTAIFERVFGNHSEEKIIPDLSDLVSERSGAVTPQPKPSIAEFETLKPAAPRPKLPMFKDNRPKEIFTHLGSKRPTQKEATEGVFSYLKSKVPRQEDATKEKMTSLLKSIDEERDQQTNRKEENESSQATEGARIVTEAKEFLFLDLDKNHTKEIVKEAIEGNESISLREILNTIGRAWRDASRTEPEVTEVVVLEIISSEKKIEGTLQIDDVIQLFSIAIRSVGQIASGNFSTSLNDRYRFLSGATCRELTSVLYTCGCLRFLFQIRGNSFETFATAQSEESNPKTDEQHSDDKGDCDVFLYVEDVINKILSEFTVFRQMDAEFEKCLPEIVASSKWFHLADPRVERISSLVVHWLLNRSSSMPLDINWFLLLLSTYGLAQVSLRKLSIKLEQPEILSKCTTEQLIHIIELFLKSGTCHQGVLKPIFSELTFVHRVQELDRSQVSRLHDMLLHHELDRNGSLLLELITEELKTPVYTVEESTIPFP